MRKTTFLFTLLLGLLFSVGAWADNTVTVTTGSQLWSNFGTFTQVTSENWGTTWKSTDNSVCVQSARTGMIWQKGSQMAAYNSNEAGNTKNTYTIWTPADDVMITGYTITFTSNAASGNSVITAGTQSVTSTGSANEQTLTVSGIFAHFTQFSVATNHANVKEFTITTTTLPAQTAEGYYLINNPWQSYDGWLYANSSQPTKLWKKKLLTGTRADLLTDENNIWKVTQNGSYYTFYNIGANRYISNFSTANSASDSQIGSSVNLLNATASSDAEIFVSADRSAVAAGALRFRAMSKATNCYLESFSSSENYVGFYNKDDDGNAFVLYRYYKVTLRNSAETLKTIYHESGSSTGFNASEFDGCTFSIGGVVKTADEVAAAIQAQTENNLEVVVANALANSITSAAEIETNKVYTLTTARGYLQSRSDSNRYVAWTPTGTANAETPANQWAFVTVDGGANYYLYNVGTKRFIASRLGTSNMLDNTYTAHAVTVSTTGDATYPINLKDGDWTFNSQSGNNLLIDDWNYVDDGNKWKVQAVYGISFDATEAQNMLTSILNATPFEVSTSLNGGPSQTKWYYMSMRPDDGNNGYFAYVPADYDYSSPANVPLATTTGAKELTDNYLWCVMGDAQNGYQLFNKAAGASRVFVFDGGGKIKDLTGNETASKFYLARANANNGNGSPTMVFKNTPNRPNRQSNSIASWANSDTGSEFHFERVNFQTLLATYTELAANCVGYVNSFNATDCPRIITAVSTVNDPAHYNEFVSGAEAAKIQKVENAYYHIVSAYPEYEKKQGVKKALFYNGTRIEWKTFDANDGAFKFQLKKSGDNWGIWSVAAGKYLVTNADVANNLGDSFTAYSFNDLGYAQFNLSDGTGLLHTAGHNSGSGVSGNITRWGGGLYTASVWYLVPVTETLSIIDPVAVGTGEDVYQTFANGYDCEVSNADVYYITGQNANSAQIAQATGNYVPAGTGVILKGAKSATVSVTPYSGPSFDSNLTSSNLLVAGDGTTNVAQGNYMLAYNSTDTQARFYPIGASGYVVPANKAYLPSGGSSTNILSLTFGSLTGIETATQAQPGQKAVFDLQGRRVEKAQKGLYIVNGKKVLVK